MNTHISAWENQNLNQQLIHPTILHPLNNPLDTTFSHHQTAQAAHTYPQPHQSTHMDQPLQSQHDPPHSSTSAMSHLFCKTSELIGSKCYLISQKFFATLIPLLMQIMASLIR
jgi:hypothetical protein